jgi:hypothetical protein
MATGTTMATIAISIIRVVLFIVFSGDRWLFQTLRAGVVLDYKYARKDFDDLELLGVLKLKFMEPETLQRQTIWQALYR